MTAQAERRCCGSPRPPRRPRPSASASPPARRSPARVGSAAANSGSGASRKPAHRPQRAAAGRARAPGTHPPPPAVPEPRRGTRRGATAPRRRRRRADAPPALRRHDRRAVGVRQPLHHAQAQPHREAAVRRLQRAIPAAGVDADRPHLHAMLAGVAHDLRRRVEAHRLRVQQRAAEHVRMVALQPGRGIGDQREAGRVALRESRSCRSPRSG